MLALYPAIETVLEIGTEHNSATIGFEVYRPLLRKASWLLRNQNNVMLLADRGFANQALLKWLNSRSWHYSISIILR